MLFIIIKNVRCLTQTTKFKFILNFFCVCQMCLICICTALSGTTDDLPGALLNKLSEIDMDNGNSEQGYSLGQTIHVKGKIKIFRETKEIVAYYHSIL